MLKTTTSIINASQITGVLPVVNGGTGVTTSTGTGNTVLSAAPTFSSGIGVGGATAGAGGVAFPATAVAVTDANTLDDYEEGTWTPSIGGDATYTNRSGSYIKIGKSVFVRALIIINIKGTGSINTISGLPFTTANLGGYHSTFAVSYFESASVPIAFATIAVNSNATDMTVHVTTIATSTILTGTAFFANSTRIEFSGCYIASA
jgi:hypothetical protein